MKKSSSYYIPGHDLSKREWEVIRLIVEEKTTSEIADELFVSKHTIETHRKNILSKLPVRNVVGVVKFALNEWAKNEYAQTA